MIKLVKINTETKQCTEVAIGTDATWYISQGFTEQEVEQAYDGSYWLKGNAPLKPTLTTKEIRLIRENLYKIEVDPLTAEIARKRDQMQDVSELMALRDNKVVEIKENNPYPDESAGL